MDGAVLIGRKNADGTVVVGVIVVGVDVNERVAVNLLGVDVREDVNEVGVPVRVAVNEPGVNVLVLENEVGLFGVVMNGAALFTKGDVKFRNRWAAAGETMTASNPRAATPSAKGLLNDRSAVVSVGR